MFQIAGICPKAAKTARASLLFSGGGTGLWEDYPPIRMGRGLGTHCKAAPYRGQRRLERT